MNFYRNIRAILAILIGEVADISRRIALMPQPAFVVGMSQEEQHFTMYQRALVRLLMYVALFPLPILVFGVIGGFGWLVATAALFWAIPTIALLVVATPLGIVWNVFSGRSENDGLGKRYVRFALSILYGEMALALLLIVVPVRNHLSALPIVLLCAVMIGIGRYLQGKFAKNIVYSAASVTMTVLILSFYAPRTYGVLGRWVGTWDDRATETIAPMVGDTVEVHVVPAGFNPNPGNAGNSALPPYSVRQETTMVVAAGDTATTAFLVSKKTRTRAVLKISAPVMLLWQSTDGAWHALREFSGESFYDPTDGPMCADPQKVRVVAKGNTTVHVGVVETQ